MTAWWAVSSISTVSTRQSQGSNFRGRFGIYCAEMGVFTIPTRL
jgi:hypothetical protein